MKKASQTSDSFVHNLARSWQDQPGAEEMFHYVFREWPIYSLNKRSEERACSAPSKFAQNWLEEKGYSCQLVYNWKDLKSSVRVDDDDDEGYGYPEPVKYESVDDDNVMMDDSLSDDEKAEILDFLHKNRVHEESSTSFIFELYKVTRADDESFKAVMAVSNRISPSNFAVDVAHNSEAFDEILPELFKKFENFPPTIRKAEEFYLVTTTPTGALRLQPFKLTKSVDNVMDNYEDEFTDIHKHVVEKLENSHKGIVLLYGEPGTGKTSYLRHLIRSCKSKVAFLPPDLAPQMSTPAFLTFLTSNPNLVLIIEDAENVLETREAGNNQAVANILNVSDGLLGDALRIQIIATFNTQIEKIDTALRRPGRLIAEYHFKALSLKKTKELMKRIHGDGVVAMKQMTLAEIYAHKEPKFKEEKVTNAFGFV